MVSLVLQQHRCHARLPAFAVLADWYECVGGLCAYHLVKVCALQFVQERGLSPFRAGFGTWNIPWYGGEEKNQVGHCHECSSSKSAALLFSNCAIFLCKLRMAVCTFPNSVLAFLSCR